jgi:hypothetical protein
MHTITKIEKAIIQVGCKCLEALLDPMHPLLKPLNLVSLAIERPVNVVCRRYCYVLDV